MVPYSQGCFFHSVVDYYIEMHFLFFSCVINKALSVNMQT